MDDYDNAPEKSGVRSARTSKTQSRDGNQTDRGERDDVAARNRSVAPGQVVRSFLGEQSDNFSGLPPVLAFFREEYERIVPMWQEYAREGRNREQRNLADRVGALGQAVRDLLDDGDVKGGIREVVQQIESFSKDLQPAAEASPTRPQTLRAHELTQKKIEALNVLVDALTDSVNGLKLVVEELRPAKWKEREDTLIQSVADVLMTEPDESVSEEAHQAERARLSDDVKQVLHTGETMDVVNSMMLESAKEAAANLKPVHQKIDEWPDRIFKRITKLTSVDSIPSEADQPHFQEVAALLAEGHILLCHASREIESVSSNMYDYYRTQLEGEARSPLKYIKTTAAGLMEKTPGYIRSGKRLIKKTSKFFKTTSEEAAEGATILFSRGKAAGLKRGLHNQAVSNREWGADILQKAQDTEQSVREAVSSTTNVLSDYFAAAGKKTLAGMHRNISGRPSPETVAMNAVLRTAPLPFLAITQRLLDATLGLRVAVAAARSAKGKPDHVRHKAGQAKEEAQKSQALETAWQTAGSDEERRKIAIERAFWSVVATARESRTEDVRRPTAETVQQALGDARKMAHAVAEEVEKTITSEALNTELAATLRRVPKGEQACAEEKLADLGKRLEPAVQEIQKAAQDLREAAQTADRSDMKGALKDALLHAGRAHSRGANVKQQIKLAITQATGTPLHNYSRRGLLAKAMGEWIEDQKEAYSNAHTDMDRKTIDRAMKKILEEKIQRDFSLDTKDPEAILLSRMIELAQQDARHDRVLWPLTPQQFVDVHSKKPSEYLASWGEKKISYNLALGVTSLFTGQGKEAAKYFGSLGARNMLAPRLGPLMTLWRALNIPVNVRKLRNLTVPGQDLPEDEIDEYVKRELFRFGFKMLTSLLPRVVTNGMALAFTMGGLLEGGEYRDEFIQRARKRLKTDFGFAGAYAGGSGAYRAHQKYSHLARKPRAPQMSGTDPANRDAEMHSGDSNEEISQDEPRASFRGKRESGGQVLFDTLTESAVSSGGNAELLILSHLAEVCKKWNVSQSIMDENIVAVIYRKGEVALYQSQFGIKHPIPDPYLPDKFKQPLFKQIRVSPMDMATGKYIDKIDNAKNGGRWSLVSHKICWPSIIPKGMQEELSDDIFVPILSKFKELQKDDPSNDPEKRGIGTKIVSRILKSHGIQEDEASEGSTFTFLEKAIFHGKTLSIRVERKEYELSNCFIFKGDVYFINGIRISLAQLNQDFRENAVPEEIKNQIISGMHGSDLENLGTGYKSIYDAVFMRHESGKYYTRCISEIVADNKSEDRMEKWLGDRFVRRTVDSLERALVSKYDINLKIAARVASAAIASAVALYGDPLNAKLGLLTRLLPNLPKLIEISMRKNPAGRADDLIGLAKSTTTDVAVFACGRFLKAIRERNGNEAVSKTIKEVINKIKKANLRMTSSGRAPIVSIEKLENWDVGTKNGKVILDVFRDNPNEMVGFVNALRDS